MTGAWNVIPSTEILPAGVARLLQPGNSLAIQGISLTEILFSGDTLDTSTSGLIARFGSALTAHENTCVDGTIWFWFAVENPRAVGDEARTCRYGLALTTRDAAGNVAAGFEAFEVTTPNQPTVRRVEQPLTLLRRP